MELLIYHIVQYIHILAAVAGLGAAFGYPVLARTAKAVTEAKQILHLFEKLSFVPIVSSVTLIITSVVMAYLKPEILSHTWFISSLFVYIIAQVYVVKLLPKQMKAQLAILEAQPNEEIPAEYKQAWRRTVVIERTTQLLALLLIILVVFKPM